MTATTPCCACCRRPLAVPSSDAEFVRGRAAAAGLALPNLLYGGRASYLVRARTAVARALRRERGLTILAISRLLKCSEKTVESYLSDAAAERMRAAARARRRRAQGRS